MNHNPVLCAGDLSLTDARDLLKKFHGRRMPVVDKNGQLVGILSERDFLRISPLAETPSSADAALYPPSKFRVRDVMTKKVITVTEEMPIEAAVRLMDENRIGGLPGVNEAHEVVGIISDTDILKVFLEFIGRAVGRFFSLYHPD